LSGVVGNVPKESTIMRLRVFCYWLVYLFFTATLFAGCAKPQREFSAEVFVVTKGGGSLKLGLITVNLIDEEKIATWQPAMMKKLKEQAERLRDDLDTALAACIPIAKEYDETTRVYDEADKNYKKNMEIIKSMPDDLALANKEKSIKADWDEKKKALEEAFAEREKLRSQLEEKKQLRLVSLRRVAEAGLSAQNWPVTAAELIFKEIPKSVASSKTDADGKCAGKVPKPGKYAVAAEFSRLVGETEEHYRWLIWITFDNKEIKKITLSNDNMFNSVCPENIFKIPPFKMGRKAAANTAAG